MSVGQLGALRNFWGVLSSLVHEEDRSIFYMCSQVHANPGTLNVHKEQQ